MTYIQWLGSWLESYPYYEDFKPSAEVGLAKAKSKESVR
jgi:hypothetical protein